MEEKMETQVVIEKIEKTTSMPVLKLASSYPGARVHGRVITTKVVGVSFEGRQEVVARLQMGDRCWLSMEPENAYDSNAIAVSRSNGEQIGYLNRHLAASIVPYFRAYRFPVKGKISLITGSAWDGYQLGAVVSFKIPKLTYHNHDIPELDWDE
jgi:hypothetical protein